MVYSPFRTQSLIRIILLSISIFLSFFFSFVYHFYLFSGLMAVLSLLQVYLLFKHFDKANRELARFFNSIKFTDFSQSFFTNTNDKGFNELNNSLLNVMNQFRQARSEKEEHFQYLQTVVRHIGTGLISFKQSGQVELINNAAKKLLDVNDLKNINTLPKGEKSLTEHLLNIKSGEKELVRFQQNGKELQLSIYAVEFKMHGEKYTLVSLQDIKNELERERMANELFIAHDVQTRLLPKATPFIPDYTIDAVCLPAKEVGGDYYDFVKIDDSKVGIVIGDVAGKGLPAAFYMILTKGIFQASAETGNKPKEVLKKINDLIYRSMARGTFVTMLYGVLDYKENTFTFARAGHEPLLFVSAEDQKVIEYKPNGIGVGLERGTIFCNNLEEEVIKLKKDDLIFLYTDGLTDLRNETDEEYGFERIKDLICNNQTKSTRNLINAFLEDVKEFRNEADQFDDLTIITLKYSD